MERKLKLKKGGYWVDPVSGKVLDNDLNYVGKLKVKKVK